MGIIAGGGGAPAPLSVSGVVALLSGRIDQIAAAAASIERRVEGSDRGPQVAVAHPLNLEMGLQKLLGAMLETAESAAAALSMVCARLGPLGGDD